MVLIFGYFIKYFMYLIHIQIGKTLGEHYVPCTRFLDWKTLVNLNVFKGYQNLLNLLNTLCIYVISQVYSQVGNNPLFPVCVFIPLTMFTSELLRTIHDNVGDLYTKRKMGFAAGKYNLNSDLFPNENILTEQTFFQAYRNWVKLIMEVADEPVSTGWHAYHSKMI